MIDSNPLLSDAYPPPFDAIDASHVEPAVDALLDEARQRLAQLEGLSDPPTFANTMLALEAATERLERSIGLVRHLEAVATTPALREASNAAQPRVSEFLNGIPLSSKLWAVVARYAASDEAKALTGPRARFVKKTVSYFKRHGAQLDSASKERLAALNLELTKLTLRYSQNALDASNAYELVVSDEARLSGLSDNAVQAAAQSAREKNATGWRFTLQAPSYIPVLRYADDRDLREQLYRAVVSRASSGGCDNRPLVARILELRSERAQLLGYAHFADLVTEERMAKSGDRARAFINDLEARTRDHFERETAELQAFRDGIEGDSQPLQPWDVAYFAEKQRKQRYSYDAEKLRAYFALENVLSGLFAITGELYGIRFEPWPEAPRWHDSVRSYKLVDEAGQWRASIQVDPFPRESKQSGAWMDGLISCAAGDPQRKPLGMLVANVTPPVGDEDAYLSHTEVQTMFHEMGHLMHHCLSNTGLRSQAGTSVAWDFVELPSQIFENWCWEREALDRFAKHRDSAEPIPDELLTAMLRARTFQAASGQMRQLGFAHMDLSLHVDYDAAKHGDLVDYSRNLLESFSPTALPQEHAMVAAFDHLFGSPVGYAAGYYSYKWAEVLDADAFTRFRSEGLFNAKTGRAFRDEILARGDEEAPEVLFRNFMGRDPDLNALLERLGIAS